MRESRAPALRKLLRGPFADGATARQLREALGMPNTEISNKTIANAMACMPDTYIDRWARATGARGAWAAVWCAVEVPEDCPRPEPKGKSK